MATPNDGHDRPLQRALRFTNECEVRIRNLVCIEQEFVRELESEFENPAASERELDALRRALDRWKRIFQEHERMHAQLQMLQAELLQGKADSFIAFLREHDISEFVQRRGMPTVLLSLFNEDIDDLVAQLQSIGKRSGVERIS